MHKTSTKNMSTDYQKVYYNILITLGFKVMKIVEN